MEIQDGSGINKNPQAYPSNVRPFSDSLTIFISMMAIIMGIVSAACIGAVAYSVFGSEIKLQQNEDWKFWILGNFNKSITLLIASLLAGIFGIFFLRVAKASLAHIIPPEDREMLNDLIKNEKAEGVNLYVRLSSLRGFSGTFSHLGITGLPLATIALTLIFSVLAIWTSDKNTLNGSFLDLAKLTLGAFIGSFVQRQISPDLEKNEAEKAKAALAAAATAAALKAEAEKAEGALAAAARKGEKAEFGGSCRNSSSFERQPHWQQPPRQKPRRQKPHGRSRKGRSRKEQRSKKERRTK